jgi:serine/threonine-protein kinase
MMTLLMMQLNDRPAPPRALRPDLPEALERLVLRLLEKRPERRIQTCRELAAELRQAAGAAGPASPSSS